MRKWSRRFGRTQEQAEFHPTIAAHRIECQEALIAAEKVRAHCVVVLKLQGGR